MIFVLNTKIVQVVNNKMINIAKAALRRPIGFLFCSSKSNITNVNRTSKYPQQKYEINDGEGMNDLGLN